MPKQINLGNTVVAAAEEACGLFGVPCYRMQSRTFTVVGTGGRSRPMFVGQWRDRTGIIHHRGMADLLLTPSISDEKGWYITVPLWVECKAGTGALRSEQIAFRDDVLAAGAHHLELRDSAGDLLDWFQEQGVHRR